MSEFIAHAGFGVVYAGAFALAAVGFTLQFSVTNVLNIAYGALMSLAAFICYAFNVQLGLNIWLSLFVTVLVGGVASVLLNRGLIQPFLRRGTTFFGMVVITIALDLIIEYVIEAIWGPNFFHYNLAAGTPLRLGSLMLTHVQVIALGMSVASMVAIQLLLKQTRLGKAMRATSCDVKLAKVCGIRVSLVYDTGWFISGAMASMAGVILALSLATFDYTIGDTYLIVIIAATMLGGIGQVYGAMLGALVIGLVTQESTLVIPSGYGVEVAFLILILVLLFRPTGIIAGIAADRHLAS